MADRPNDDHRDETVEGSDADDTTSVPAADVTERREPETPDTGDTVDQAAEQVDGAQAPSTDEGEGVADALAEQTEVGVTADDTGAAATDVDERLEDATASAATADAAARQARAAASLSSGGVADEAGADVQPDLSLNDDEPAGAATASEPAPTISSAPDPAAAARDALRRRNAGSTTAGAAPTTNSGGGDGGSSGGDGAGTGDSSEPKPRPVTDDERQALRTSIDGIRGEISELANDCGHVASRKRRFKANKAQRKAITSDAFSERWAEIDERKPPYVDGPGAAGTATTGGLTAELDALQLQIVSLKDRTKHDELAERIRLLDQKVKAARNSVQRFNTAFDQEVDGLGQEIKDEGGGVLAWVRGGGNSGSGGGPGWRPSGRAVVMFLLLALLVLMLFNYGIGGCFQKIGGWFRDANTGIQTGWSGNSGGGPSEAAAAAAKEEEQRKAQEEAKKQEWEAAKEIAVKAVDEAKTSLNSLASLEEWFSGADTETRRAFDHESCRSLWTMLKASDGGLANPGQRAATLTALEANRRKVDATVFTMTSADRSIGEMQGITREANDLAAAAAARAANLRTLKERAEAVKAEARTAAPPAGGDPDGDPDRTALPPKPVEDAERERREAEAREAAAAFQDALRPFLGLWVEVDAAKDGTRKTLEITDDGIGRRTPPYGQKTVLVVTDPGGAEGHLTGYWVFTRGRLTVPNHPGTWERIEAFVDENEILYVYQMKPDGSAREVDSRTKKERLWRYQRAD